jgi:Sulfotransferase family
VGFQLNYSALDRCLHRIAFGAPSIQLAAADLERRSCGAVYAAARAERPIFITSLPRAGTTLLLEALNHFPALAAHSYRDMPFVMAPVFWSRLSGAFRKSAELNERAHGDGMAVGYDSPEAFEEILWRAFWPEKYTNNGIALWGPGDANEEARAFFAEHMKKIVALRRPGRLGDGRYLSKNNANIARLDLLAELFPGATVLVPFRAPLAHAASLHRQHLHFAAMHAEEPFVRRYMADIGHYEFGALHRPLAFPGLAELTRGRDPQNLDYWLAYWIAAFDHVLARRDKVVLLSYEAACADGGQTLATLCEKLALDPEDQLEPATALFRAPRPPEIDTTGLDPALLDRAEALHAALCGAAE